MCKKKRKRYVERSKKKKEEVRLLTIWIWLGPVLEIHLILEHPSCGLFVRYPSVFLHTHVRRSSEAVNQ